MKQGALIPRYIANKAMLLRREESYELAALRKIPFFTALWASGGVAMMAGSMYHPYIVSNFMAENWPVVVPFVFGVYASSYALGKLLVNRKVRENIFASIAVSFAVSELVLLLGCLFGAVGKLAQALVQGNVMQHMESIVYGPFFIAMFGAMFCFPLAVGLGAHVRIWSKLQQRKLASGELHEETAELEQPLALPAGG